MSEVVPSRGSSESVSRLTFPRLLPRAKDTEPSVLGFSEEDLEEKEDGRGRASRFSEIPRPRTRFLQAPFAAPLHYTLQETLLWLTGNDSFSVKRSFSDGSEAT